MQGFPLLIETEGFYVGEMPESKRKDVWRLHFGKECIAGLSLAMKNE
jgi:hypothetical protein